jgi:hypothetical protein
VAAAAVVAAEGRMGVTPTAAVAAVVAAVARLVKAVQVGLLEVDRSPFTYGDPIYALKAAS